MSTYFQVNEVKSIAGEINGICKTPGTMRIGYYNTGHQDFKIREKLDRYNNNMREGAQEYVQLCYYNEWTEYRDDDYYLYIFRDGAVYYDYFRNVSENLLGNSANLYDFLLRKMKQGPEKYMSL